MADVTQRGRFEERWAQGKAEKPIATAIFHLRASDDTGEFQRWAHGKEWNINEPKVIGRLVLMNVPHTVVGALLRELDQLKSTGTHPGWLELVLISPATPNDQTHLFLFVPLEKHRTAA